MAVTRKAPPPQASSSAHRPAAAPARQSPRWLLFVHQLPSQPSNLRVKTWRRMQQLGAIAIKQAVYALPDSAGAREDFEWLRTELEAQGGEVSVFAADSVSAWSDDALIEEFRRSRQEAYAEIAGDLEQALKTAARRTGRRMQPHHMRRSVEAFRERLAAVEQVDFFGSAGRDRVVVLLAQLEARIGHADPVRSSSADAGGTRPREVYRGRLWVTRPRPGVDRMSSAWLIRRFIDPEARFDFVADRDVAPPEALPFDMFGVEFTHRGEDCTFETLLTLFAIDEPAARRVAEIVHDLDLKDARFGAPEAAAIGALIDGLQLAHGDDARLLDQGMMLFDALFRAFEHAARPPRPIAVARRGSKRPRP
jgi:hypothetical protein